jgi:hypothetical protein
MESGLFYVNVASISTFSENSNWRLSQNGGGTKDIKLSSIRWNRTVNP